ncbi:hypothetical protein IW261DRAFT_1417991 [Armillaria novae-zelandiae]|uniref:Uncharacterized protein n=1 Tax=Armillaria novae-zelandiae TaxID=153914 RepID=A0AA39PEP6_9AGAR|nr:hypothetical protein IW261DRAFT_1417991 [Armillaria novae-zelandiae]
MSFGIALYYYGLNADPYHPLPYLHWAFVSSERPWSENNITCYEIIRQDNFVWKWHFTRPGQAKSARFSGIAKLIDEIIRTYQPANDNEWTVAGPNGWTCATWVMKLVIDLEEQGYFNFPDGISVDNLYRTVLEKGEILRDLKGVTMIPILPLAQDVIEARRASFCRNSI